MSYQFTQLTCQSQDSQRHYQIYLGKPGCQTPTTGFALIYLLDGNAAYQYLTSDLLNQLFSLTPPIIVAIGYQTVQLFDVKARTFDYTPTNAQITAYPDPWNEQFLCGGANTFRHFLLTKIDALLRQRFFINPYKRAIWGHSYGGLWVLDTLLKSTKLFSHYYAASPSLGWCQPSMQSQLTSLNNPLKHAKNKRIQIYYGDAERITLQQRLQDPNLDKLSRQKITLRLQSSAQLVPEFCEYLRTLNLNVTDKVLPNLSHGQTFAAALQASLIDFAS